MQKPHRPLPVNKHPRALQLRIAPAIKIFSIIVLLFALLPCLHQCKVYAKGKLRVWRVQKCNFLVGAKTAPTITCPQTTPCLAIPYRASNEIFEILGILFAMVPCLHQCKVYIKRKLRVWRAQNCNFQVSAKTAPTSTSQQTTPCFAATYCASNRNFRNFGDTFHHGTVITSMQSLY